MSIPPAACVRRTRRPARERPGGTRAEAGFALFTTMVLTIIVALVLGASLRTTEFGERLAGSSIQRNRAFYAAEGALTLGERDVADTAATRTFASIDGVDGLFSLDALGALDPPWWRDPDFDGAIDAPADTFVGVGRGTGARRRGDRRLRGRRRHRDRVARPG